MRFQAAEQEAALNPGTGAAPGHAMDDALGAWSAPASAPVDTSPLGPAAPGQTAAGNPDAAQLFSGLYGSSASTTQVAAAPGGASKKKVATKAEIAAIQQLIDKAKAAEVAAADLEDDAAIAAHSGDPKGAAAKKQQADAKRREARALKQEAIARAVSAYGVDVSHVKSLLYASDNSDGDSETDEDRSVTIGDDAFRSAGWLGSTIAHEAEVHVNMQSMKGRNYAGPQGSALNEIQGYDYELGQAKRFGLTKDETDGLRRNRDHYLGYLDSGYKKRRSQGNYYLDKGHEAD